MRINDVLRNFEEFGRSLTPLQLPTLKFSQGVYLVNDGVSDTPFENVKLIAQMPTLRWGWMRWDSGFAIKQIMGLVSENFEPPPREELGDLDESAWETKGEGRGAFPLDPWHETYDVVVEDANGCDARNPSFLLTFDSSEFIGAYQEFSSYHVFGSLGTLCRLYATHARRVPDELPVIELTSTHCHPAIPQINVVDWWSEERSTAAARSAEFHKQIEAERARTETKVTRKKAKKS